MMRVMPDMTITRATPTTAVKVATQPDAPA
jgi:hypothetical protein